MSIQANLLTCLFGMFAVCTYHRKVPATNKQVNWLAHGAVFQSSVNIFQMDLEETDNLLFLFN